MVKRGHRGSGLKHQKEKRSMDHFAGLDVSVNETSICIVDGAGRIVRETKVASEPEALLAVLKNAAYHFERVGLEAGPLSPVCLVDLRLQHRFHMPRFDTDHRQACLGESAEQPGFTAPFHVKTLRSQK